MFTKIMIGTLSAVMIVAAGMTACTAQAAPVAESESVESIPAADLDDASEVIPTVSQPVTSTSLTTEEISGLLYMYEEEKLAMDVYNALYAQWDHPVFQNIASSEQTHMDAVQTLLVRYGIPVPEMASGSYSDPALQSLYTELMANGSKSLADALKVGATIEEVDIVDLQTRFAQTEKMDIQQVYNSLMLGSYNHLRAYVRVVERQTGVAYQPQYLTDDLYQSILAGSQGNGRSWGGSGTYPGDSTERGKGFGGGN
jgi:hypothetical protein